MDKYCSCVLLAWYPGQENGNAVVEVLFGDVNPSGKSPITFPVSDSQVPASTPQQYPGVNNEETYSEGLLVGYRWYSTKSIQPLVPFGHGLSYTTFFYSSFSLSCRLCRLGQKITGAIRIANTGSVAGAEVAQAYLSFPVAAKEPVSQLIGFQKVFLAPGASQTISFVFEPRRFSTWVNDTWVQFPGNFIINIGSSSQDTRASAALLFS